jgi:N-acetylmuramoyl-L-alanine amidase
MSKASPKCTKARTPWFSVFVLAAAGLALSNCSSVDSSRGSSGLDALGHRPGPQGFSTVIIDAGHGGRDSGAVSRRNGAVEKELALDLAMRLRSELGGSFRTVMTRDSDTFVDLDQRVRIANRYSNGVLVSMHLNSCGPRSAGPETYFWRVDSYSLGKRVQQNLSSVAEQHNSQGLVRRRLRLTRNPSIPCILVECGYISNAREARQLNDPTYRARLAHAVAAAIKTQAAIGDAGMGPLPPPINAPLSTHHDARS